MALAAYYNYEIEHIDIKNAFLQSDLEEEIYIEKIEGLAEYFKENPSNNTIKYKADNTQFFLLKRLLYRLKQSPRN